MPLSLGPFILLFWTTITAAVASTATREHAVDLRITAHPGEEASGRRALPTLDELRARGRSVLEAERLNISSKRILFDRHEGTLYTFGENLSLPESVSQLSADSPRGEATDIERVFAYDSTLGRRIVTVAKQRDGTRTVRVWSRDLMRPLQEIALQDAADPGSMPDSRHLVFRHRSDPDVDIQVDLASHSVQLVRARHE